MNRDWCAVCRHPYAYILVHSRAASSSSVRPAARYRRRTSRRRHAVCPGQSAVPDNRSATACDRLYDGPTLGILQICARRARRPVVVSYRRLRSTTYCRSNKSRSAFAQLPLRDELETECPANQKDGRSVAGRSRPQDQRLDLESGSCLVFDFRFWLVIICRFLSALSSISRHVRRSVTSQDSCLHPTATQLSQRFDEVVVIR